MTVVLERAGAAFLRAFGAGIVTYGIGVWAAPNLNAGIALGAAAVASALAAGIRAVQVFVPQLSFKSLVGTVPGAYVDSFARSFIGYGLTAATGWLLAPDLANWKAVAVGAVTGAFAAGFRALQGLLTSGESPAP
jgi:hypothetical protein